MSWPPELQYDEFTIKWGFPKIRGTFLGVPAIRSIVFCGLYWGPPTLGNYQVFWEDPHPNQYSIMGDMYDLGEWFAQI